MGSSYWISKYMLKFLLIQNFFQDHQLNLELNLILKLVLVDSAFPGMLPVINEYCIQQAIKTGLGLNAKINSYSVFDRKNYFYADLPQGYQISQYKNPIVGEGKITLDLPNGNKNNWNRKTSFRTRCRKKYSRS